MIKRPCAYVHLDIEGELTDEQKPVSVKIGIGRKSAVSCPVCRAYGPIKDTEDEAIFAWNHREEA